MKKREGTKKLGVCVTREKEKRWTLIRSGRGAEKRKDTNSAVFLFKDNFPTISAGDFLFFFSTEIYGSESGCESWSGLKIQGNEGIQIHALP